MDQVAAEVGLPPDLVLAIHDSTWEFSNEAAAAFARVHHDLALERAHFDAERRSTYAGGVLRGTFTADRLLFAEVGPNLAFIAPRVPDHFTGHLVAAGPAAPLDLIHLAFAVRQPGVAVSNASGRQQYVRAQG
ncbi:hypothetical protein [Actinoplanes sp. GCM10030250]|uniref:hypothetical protein n=1 Tax=Actinoplanes sp. GCM10030250 TaxID=3273376 RepID=UPI003614B3C0